MRRRRASFRCRCRASTIWSLRRTRACGRCRSRSDDRLQIADDSGRAARLRELRLKTVEEIKAAIEAAAPGAGVEIVPNPSVSGQHSLRIAAGHAVEVATFLRDDAELALDFLSNATGVDWPGKEVSEKVKVTRTVTKTVDGVEQQVEETV